MRLPPDSIWQGTWSRPAQFLHDICLAFGGDKEQDESSAASTQQFSAKGACCPGVIVDRVHSGARDGRAQVPLDPPGFVQELPKKCNVLAARQER